MKMAPFSKVLCSSVPAYIGALLFGFMIGYTSPCLPKMTEVDEPLHNNEDGAAWFSSLATIGGMIGCPLAGWLVDKIGRKKTLMFTSLPFLLGWLGISLGSGLDTLNTARLLTGLGGGMVCVVSPLYMSEISTKEMRGKFGTAVQLFITIGIVTVYALGIALSWRMLALFCSVVPVFMILSAIYIPETPRYLLNQGMRQEAFKVLIKLRETSSSAEAELSDMEEATDDMTMSFKEFLSPELYKPLVMALTIMIFQQLSGINGVMFYTVSIFMAAGFKQEQSALATCLVGLVQVIMTTVAAILMDRAGRRILLIVAGVGMAVSSLVMSLCFYYQPIASNPESTVGSTVESSGLGSLVLLSLVVYIAAFALGWGPIPMLLASEVFPARARGPAIGLSTLANWFFAFLVTLYFEQCKAALGMHGIFALFGICSITAVVYVWSCVPETKGRSLEDISFFFTARVIRGI